MYAWGLLVYITDLCEKKCQQIGLHCIGQDVYSWTQSGGLRIMYVHHDSDIHLVITQQPCTNKTYFRKFFTILTSFHSKNIKTIQIFIFWMRDQHFIIDGYHWPRHIFSWWLKFSRVPRSETRKMQPLIYRKWIFLSQRSLKIYLGKVFRSNLTCKNKIGQIVMELTFWELEWKFEKIKFSSCYMSRDTAIMGKWFFPRVPSSDVVLTKLKLWDQNYKNWKKSGHMKAISKLERLPMKLKDIATVTCINQCPK